MSADQAQDNTRYAFLQMDDRVLVYRGADQPDMSVINPESDVWQHIKVYTSPDFFVFRLLKPPPDSTRVSCEKLACPILVSQLRRPTHRYRWSPRSRAL
jgi:hypothetical protein